MRVSILQLVDRGVVEKERLHLSVLVDTNLAYYVVFNTTKSGNGVTPIPQNTYWFIDTPVKAGDHVILYTTSGVNQSSARSDGKKNHFFYWGLTNAIWRDPIACAVLFEVSEWSTSPMWAGALSSLKAHSAFTKSV
jgi:hypothetical protein